MSNPLNSRRVMFQDLDEQGKPVGAPSFGVITSDNYETDLNNSFESFEELNAAIEAKGCIASLCVKFKDFVNKAVVGIANFYGKDWEE